jgi:HK97 gp10 family phage protein
MMATYTKHVVRVDGLKELDQALERLPLQIQKKVLSKAIREAGKPVAKAARALAPQETGLLRRSIKSYVKMYKRSGVWVAVIGPTAATAKARKGLTGSKAKRNPKYYGHLVEGGTKPHLQHGVTIPPLYIRLAASQHPGTKGVEFLKAAWKANDNRALEKMKQELRKGIDAEVAKL